MCAVETFSEEVTIKNKLGLHARAAAKLVRTAGRYKADIRLYKDGQEADVRSVLSLIALGCPYDSRVRLWAEGEDAAQAVTALSEVIRGRFGEE